jgi:Acetyltransferase (GNAT) domain
MFCRNSAMQPSEAIAKNNFSQAITRFSLQKNTFDAFLYEDVHQLPLLPAALLKDTFLAAAYQNVLKNEAPKGMRLAYLVFQQQQQVIGLAACQTVRFDAAENIKLPESNSGKNWSKKATYHFRKSVAQQFSFDSIVCGNLLVSGEHGFIFDATAIEQSHFVELVVAATEALRLHWSATEKPYSAVIFKDFTSLVPALAKEGFAELHLPPFMSIALPTTWKKMDDYISAMQSKYRTRARRARKKADAIVKKEFNIERIIANRDTLMALHQQVVGSAGFNLVEITPDYFAELKRQMPDDFQLFGYYLEGRLVAFYTLIRNNEELEAHFLGFDQQINQEYQIYLNILYDIIQAGISLGNIHTIQMARTAMEIKSSVGAVATPTYVYMRHESCTYTKLFGMAYQYAYPHEVWKARHPFKGDGEEGE